MCDLVVGILSIKMALPPRRRWSGHFAFKKGIKRALLEGSWLRLRRPRALHARGRFDLLAMPAMVGGIPPDPKRPLACVIPFCGGAGVSPTAPAWVPKIGQIISVDFRSQIGPDQNWGDYFPNCGDFGGVSVLPPPFSQGGKL